MDGSTGEPIDRNRRAGRTYRRPMGSSGRSRSPPWKTRSYRAATVMALSMKATSADFSNGFRPGLRAARCAGRALSTAIKIRKVFCAAATIVLPRAPFSQYSRADEAAVFVRKKASPLSRNPGRVLACRIASSGWADRPQAAGTGSGARGSVFPPGHGDSPKPRGFSLSLAQPSAGNGVPVCSPVSLIVTSLSRRQKARERIDELLLFEWLF